jgi:bacterioferritin
MPNREKSIELLNKAISEELSAVHQYMYFHFHCDDQVLDMLAGIFKKTAIEEMIHIETLAERVLFLGGEIEMTAAQPVEKINTVKEMIEWAQKSEDEAIEMYNDFAQICAQNKDSATKKIFEALVDDEERHFDQFDNEMDNYNKFGKEYLALQAVERGKGIATMPPGHPVIQP